MRAFRIASIVVSTMVFGAPTLASPTEAAAPRRSSTTRPTIEARVPTLAPFAHVVFCRKHPAECDNPSIGRTELDANVRAIGLLQRVNVSVNAAIKPASDAAGPLGDVWTLSPSKGDCDDYAVTKRRRLVAAGVPAAALRLAVTKTAAGEGHAVLVVRTTSGDLILDNRIDRLRSWRDSGLSLVKLQSGTNPRVWSAVGSVAASAE